MATSVLIVDDSEDFRASVRALLGVQGFDVVAEVEDGESALDAAERLQPDVVLLDVQLPDEDGFAVAGTLAAHRPAPAVVLVSSRSQSDYGHRVTASAARGFIAKAELSGAALRLVLGEETRAS